MKQGLFFSIIALVVMVGCGKQVSKTIPAPAPAGPRHAFINGPLTPGGNVTDRFSVTPNSQKVVYIADETTDDVNELYVANIDGSNKLKISQVIGLADDVNSFKISPDSQKVAYIANINGRRDLYTVNLDGTQRYMVNQGVPDNAHQVFDYYWLPSSTRLAYTSDELNASNDFGLYEANYDATSRLTLSPNTVAQQFSVSANGARIVYRKGTLVNPNLRSVKVDGTSDILLNTPFDLVGNPSSGIISFLIAPNSSVVIYRTNQDTATKTELYIVNIDGSGARTKLSGSLVTGGNVGIVNFSPDSSKVIYMADQDTDNVVELYMNTVTNAGSMKISGAHGVGANVEKFQALNNRVAFTGDMITDGINDLFVADYLGSVTKINSSLMVGEKIADFAADSTNIAYLMDKGNAGSFSAYGNSISGGSEVMISQPLSGGPGAFDASSPAPRQIGMSSGKVYYRSGVSSGNYQGYRVSITGGDIETLTNEDTGGSMLFADTGIGSSLVITPDGQYFVYRMNISGQKNLLSSKLQ